MSQAKDTPKPTAPFRLSQPQLYGVVLRSAHLAVRQRDHVHRGLDPRLSRNRLGGRVPAISVLSAEERRQLAAQTQVQEAPAGTIIIRKGACGNAPPEKRPAR